ncbi:MAG TPA: DNA-binding response regulator, partial [Anaerolineae bacterium]|nr:DNA-binding response regulator [Anaerolineae bacterium]
MNQEPIRVMVVDADPESGQRLAARLAGIEGLQVVEVAYNRNMTKARVQELDLDVLLV